MSIVNNSIIRKPKMPVPEIFGEFTNWQPRPMVDVQDIMNLIIVTNHEELV